MVTAIRNIRDIGTDERRCLETLVGRSLEDHQQVIIQVVDDATECDAKRRAAALTEAGAIARRGRANAAARGVTDEDVAAAIEDARHHQRS